MDNGEIYLDTGVSSATRAAFEKAKEHILLRPETPTDLCNLMRRENSDKARAPIGKHNYATLYHYLFSPIREKVERFFEVGLGTNNTSILSNMGANGTPGASLRAWQDFFPNADIFGADVDKGILFSERRIETCFIDQTELETISEALESIGTRPFNIIMDDGLHRLHANKNLYSIAHKWVEKGGFYVIEDINVHQRNIESFRTYLNSISMPVILYRLPHQREVMDNCLAVIEF